MVHEWFTSANREIMWKRFGFCVFHSLVAWHICGHGVVDFIFFIIARRKTENILIKNANFSSPLHNSVSVAIFIVSFRLIVAIITLANSFSKNPHIKSGMQMMHKNKGVERCLCDTEEWMRWKYEKFNLCLRQKSNEIIKCIL